jgi:hypothetical protein
LEIGELGIKERIDETGTTDGLTEVAGARSQFCVGAEKMEGLAEVGCVRRRKGGWGTGDGGENLGLGEAKMDAMGGAEAIEFGDVERKVDVAKARAGIIDVGKVGGGREGVGTSSGAGGKGEVELSEHLVEDKTCKEGTEWAALREAFGLEEERPGGGFGTVPACVGRVVEHIKKGKETGEGWVAEEYGATGFPRDGVEHIDNVKEEEGVGGGLASSLEVSNVSFDSSAGEVDNSVEAAGNTDTKLALGEQIRGKICRGVFEESRG